MIDAPVALVLIGSAMQAAAPASRLAASLRPRPADRDRHVAAADDSLARDPLMTGIAGIAAIYRRG